MSCLGFQLFLLSIRSRTGASTAVWIGLRYICRLAEHEYKELPRGKKKTSDLFMNLLEPLYFRVKGVPIFLTLFQLKSSFLFQFFSPWHNPRDPGPATPPHPHPPRASAWGFPWGAGSKKSPSPLAHDHTLNLIIIHRCI
jgi:hypothetical protein